MKYVYETRYEDCIKRGILSIDDTIKYHIKNDLWSNDKDKKIEQLRNFIKETEPKIQIENNRIRKQKFETWLRKLQREYYDLLGARSTMLANSAEFLSNEYAYFYMLWRCVRNVENDKLLWNSFSDIENETDIIYIQELVDKMLEASKDLDIKLIRELARFPMWRVRWKASSGNTESLFGRSSQDLTNDQFMLVYWSQIYDSVYESIDRPPDEIIEDDEKLDTWLKKQSESRTKELSQKFYSKEANVAKGNSKIENASEIYKVVEGYYDENGQFIRYNDDDRWKEIDKIRSLNSSTSRLIKQREEKQLAKTPGVFIQEHELRKRKEDREAMGGTVKYERKR